MRSPVLGGLALVVVGLALPAHARADPVLSTDRPGFANSTTSVPFGYVAVETGLGLTSSLEDRADPLITLPQALVRIGLPVGLEARVRIPSLVFRPDAPAGAEDFGASDLGLGVKLSLEDILAAALSVVAEVTLPLQANGFGADDDVTGNLNAQLGWDILPVLEIVVTANLGWARRAVQASGAAILGFDLGPVYPFAQFFGIRSASSERQPIGELGSVEVTEELYEIGFGGGVAVMTADNFQLDASVDFFPYRDRNASLGEAITVGLPEAFTESPVLLRAGVGASMLF